MTEFRFHHDLAVFYLAVAAIVFVVLFFIPAAYGRHTRKGFGPSMSTRLSWVIMESASLLTFATCIILGHQPIATAAAILGGLWILHYLHRAWIFPFRMKMGGRETPILICALAILFNCGNAYLNGRWIFTLSNGYGPSWLRDPRFLSGVIIFALGFAINYAADRKLARLREGNESGYQIPRGGLYELISCPNYFGEIIEWSGFALAVWSLPGLSFAVWTAANLAPRALTHHRWYRETFPDYPPARKALIPYIL